MGDCVCGDLRFLFSLFLLFWFRERPDICFLAAHGIPDGRWITGLVVGNGPAKDGDLGSFMEIFRNFCFRFCTT